MGHVSANIKIAWFGGPLFEVLVPVLTQKLHLDVDDAGRLLFGLEEHFLDGFFLWWLGLNLVLNGVFLHRSY